MAFFFHFKEDSNPIEGLALDAEFIDVYKGTHGIFLILDTTKAWYEMIPIIFPNILPCLFHFLQYLFVCGRI